MSIKNHLIELLKDPNNKWTVEQKGDHNVPRHSSKLLIFTAAILIASGPVNADGHSSVKKINNHLVSEHKPLIVDIAMNESYIQPVNDIDKINQLSSNSNHKNSLAIGDFDVALTHDALSISHSW